MPKFERSTAGLRDALFSEMEDLRDGVASPQEAQAFANLASKVIESLYADMRAEALARTQIEMASRETPTIEDHSDDMSS